MGNDIPFDRGRPDAGGAVSVAPGLRRLVAPNAGPFTFTGTCTYILGEGRVAVIDPGPADAGHLAALLAALAGESVEAILVTHTHRDHSGGVPALVAATGATTYGAGPHRPARSPRPAGGAPVDLGGDLAFSPDIVLEDGATVEVAGQVLSAIATPGHCANHLCFAPEGRDFLMSGDHVMAWSTTIVAPPDGAMGDYMASLRKLLDRPETRYFPGHGNPVNQPRRYIRGLIAHRRMREAAILRALAGGPRAIPDIVAEVYAGLAPALTGAAALNTLAHLEDLVERDLVLTEGAPVLDGRYSLVGGASARVRNSSRKLATRRPLTPKS